jgi:hypothetical protein
MQLRRPRVAPGSQARPSHREGSARACWAGGVGRHAVPWQRGQEVQTPGGGEEGAYPSGGRARGSPGGGGTAQARLLMVPKRVHLPWRHQGWRSPLLCDGSVRGVGAGGNAAGWWTPYVGADTQVWHCSI